MKPLPTCWWLGLGFASLMAGCQSAPTGTPVVVAPAHQTEDSALPTPAPLTTESVLAMLSEMDNALARDNCLRVAEIATTLGISNSSRALAAVPATTAAAVAICDSLIHPRDSPHAKSAAQTLAEASTRSGPIIDKAWIERIRAERLLAARQEEKALAAKRKERDILASQEQRLRVLDLDISDLSEATARLSSEDKAALRRILANTQNDAHLFEALRDLDDILAHTRDATARTVLITERSHIVARVEQLFAIEVAQLEEKRATRRDAEARAQALEMKKRFPTRSYEMRIDAIMGDAGMPASGNAIGTLSEGENRASGGTLDTPVTEASMLDKALSDARISINSGDPAAAVGILDGIPEKDRTDKVRRLRKEATELHIKDLRTRVRDIYSRASSQSNKPLKLGALKQCKEILELILSRYPDTASRPGVERNLRSINSEIEFLSKGS